MAKRNQMGVVLLCAVTLFPLVAMSQEGFDEFEELSLKSLGEIVTSVSKKPEDSFRSASAIYVINNQDIKHSGATHIAEVLRGVPGLHVARLDANNWAITSRGFNSVFSNKLLVLVDGRTIYTPMFSGVYWDIQNIPLDDVERIEVIRGPGASLWGANAVNGIINIITKSAKDTQGTLATTAFGNEDKNVSDVRYGGKTAEDLYYRVYGHYESRDSTERLDGMDGNNNWINAKTGFRTDWKDGESEKFTVQGDFYNGEIDLDQTVPSFTSPTGFYTSSDQIHAQGYNLLGRWDIQQSSDMNTKLQGYVDYQSHKYAYLQQEIYTFDLDYQTSWQSSERNNVMWGGGARLIRSDLGDSFDITEVKDITTSHILSAFVQDQYALAPDELYLTVGSKIEHNRFTGFEFEPNARLAWYPTEELTLWGAVSRAVRMPGILERSASFNVDYLDPGVIAQLQPDRDYLSETAISYELGYRIKPLSNLMFDSTLFLTSYDRLRSFEPQDVVIDASGAFLPMQISNVGQGTAQGFELSANWDVSSRWSLLANYSYLGLDLTENNSQDPAFLATQESSPNHQLMLRSQLFLPNDVQLINTGYYVSDLSALNVDEYVRFDTQIIWQPTAGIELSLAGQNLLQEGHQEFTDSLASADNNVPRTVYGRVTFRF
jgi:iron complex outermembrane receptor protein